MLTIRKARNTSSMALYRDFHLHRASLPGSTNAGACARRDILRRIFAATERWHQRHAEQEAGQFIAEHGGRLTDNVERQLTEHFNGGRGFPPYASPRTFRPFTPGR